MTASEGTWGKGVTLSRDGNAIAQIVDIAPPEPTMATIPIKNHESDDDFEEFIAGWKSGGEVTLTCIALNDDTDGQTGLKTDYDNKTKQSFSLAFPSAFGATWAFSAFVTRLGTPIPLEDAIKFTATLKISGKPTLTYATASGLTTPFLAASAGVIAPSAAADEYEYVIDVPNATASITLTPTSSSADSITVDGNTVASGEASSAIALTAGEIKTVEVVCSETNKADLTYTVHIVREAT